MGGTLPERVAVVSCHVERPLDDVVWERFARLQARRPGGFAIAAFMRPADAAFGEDEQAWLERAQEAVKRGPLGHHTHWTAPDHARPTSAGAAARVLVEGGRLRELGLAPTVFCGGGWYADVEVAEACAELGYVDCTARAIRPPYLSPGEAWVELGSPARVRLPSGRALPIVPTTHSLGDLARALTRPALPQVIHAYFHDTDLLDRRRRALLSVLLSVLALRAQATDLDTLSAELVEVVPEIGWEVVARASS